MQTTQFKQPENQATVQYPEGFLQVCDLLHISLIVLSNTLAARSLLRYTAT